MKTPLRALGKKENFLGLEGRMSSYGSSKIVVLPVPYEHTVSYGGGTGRGPRAILDASRYVEFYDEELGTELCARVGIATLGRLALGKSTDAKAIAKIRAAVEKLLGLLVIKNGQLVAEGYFNGGSRERKAPLQSVTKSYTSALVGIALDRGCLSSIDHKMLEFFPKQAERITDPRKRQITVRHLLQMRGGYPWEETDPELWQALLKGHLVRRRRASCGR